MACTGKAAQGAQRAVEGVLSRGGGVRAAHGGDGAAGWWRSQGVSEGAREACEERAVSQRLWAGRACQAACMKGGHGCGTEGTGQRGDVQLG